jgi:hypothetical protein
MTIHNLEINSAHFTNNERTDIEVLLISEESTEDDVVLIPYNIEAKDGDADYEWLLSKIDLDSIHEATFKHMKQQRKDFELMVRNIAKEDGLYERQQAQAPWLTQILDDDPNNTDADDLFKIKLTMFEFDFIRESTNRALKSELRKANTIFKIVRCLFKFKEDNVEH